MMNGVLALLLLCVAILFTSDRYKKKQIKSLHTQLKMSKREIYGLKMKVIKLIEKYE